jgi:hypothetical protein
MWGVLVVVVEAVEGVAVVVDVEDAVAVEVVVVVVDVGAELIL